MALGTTEMWSILSSIGTAIGGIGAAVSAAFSLQSIRESRQSSVFAFPLSDEFEFSWSTRQDKLSLPVLSADAGWKCINSGGGAAIGATIHIILSMNKLPDSFLFEPGGDAGRGVQSIRLADQMTISYSFDPQRPPPPLSLAPYDKCSATFGAPRSDTNTPFSGWAIQAALHYLFSEIWRGVPTYRPDFTIPYNNRLVPLFTARVDWTDAGTGKGRSRLIGHYALAFVQGSQKFLEKGSEISLQDVGDVPSAYEYDEIRFRCRIERTDPPRS